VVLSDFSWLWLANSFLVLQLESAKMLACIECSSGCEHMSVYCFVILNLSMLPYSLAHFHRDTSSI
jgi:hypothetical protein